MDGHSSGLSMETDCDFQHQARDAHAMTLKASYTQCGFPAYFISFYSHYKFALILEIWHPHAEVNLTPTTML